MIHYSFHKAFLFLDAFYLFLAIYEIKRLVKALDSSYFFV